MEQNANKAPEEVKMYLSITTEKKRDSRSGGAEKSKQDVRRSKLSHTNSKRYEINSFCAF
jgi:hypothetical protein